MNKNKLNLWLSKNYWKYFGVILFWWTILFWGFVWILKTNYKKALSPYFIQVFSIYLFVLTTEQLSTYFESTIEKLKLIFQKVQGIEGKKVHLTNHIEKFHKISNLSNEQFINLTSNEKVALFIIYSMNRIYAFWRIHTRDDFTPDYKNLSYSIDGMSLIFENFMERILQETWKSVCWFYENNDEKILYDTLINLCNKEIIGYDGKSWWNLAEALDKTLMRYSSDTSRNEEYCKLSYTEKDYTQREHWTSWFSSVNNFNSDQANKLRILNEKILSKIPVDSKIQSKEKLYWNINKENLSLLENQLRTTVKNIID